MPTYIKELPSQEWLNTHYCVIDDFICWKAQSLSRGRPSTRVGKRVSTFIEGGYLRVRIKGMWYQASRVIYQMTYGNLTPEFEIDHIDRDKLNNAIANLRKVVQVVNKRNKNMQKNVGSLDTGVSICHKKHPEPYSHQISSYWVARWCDLDGKICSKNFSISKLGTNEAFRRACEYRAEMIEELNAQGAGYTERHGK